MAGTVSGAPRLLLRCEGLFVLAAAATAYGRLDARWWPFALLFFVPDLTLLGYGAGRAVGAALYNAGHWYGLPAACLAWGVLGPAPEVLAAALIWAAHIGFDRALGYGLKYAAGFGATHLGMIGTAHRDPASLSGSNVSSFASVLTSARSSLPTKGLFRKGRCSRSLIPHRSESRHPPLGRCCRL